MLGATTLSPRQARDYINGLSEEKARLLLNVVDTHEQETACAVFFVYEKTDILGGVFFGRDFESRAVDWAFQFSESFPPKPDDFPHAKHLFPEAGPFLSAYCRKLPADPNKPLTDVWPRACLCNKCRWDTMRESAFNRAFYEAVRDRFGL